MKKIYVKHKKHRPCLCYTGEISTCIDCDREFILIDIRTFRKLDPKIRKIIYETRSIEKKQRISWDEYTGGCK